MGAVHATAAPATSIAQAGQVAAGLLQHAPRRAAAPLVLGPEMTIAYAAALRETLLAAIDACDGDLLLDLGGVSDFDSSGVQLLLSARLSQCHRGHALRLVASSPAVRDALLTFGLADLLAPARAD